MNVQLDPAFTPAQKQQAEFGVELFRRLARKHNISDAATLRTYRLDGEVVGVTRALRGGGTIVVGPDHTVLYGGSSIPPYTMLPEYRAGRRTDIEKFGS